MKCIETPRLLYGLFGDGGWVMLLFLARMVPVGLGVTATCAGIINPIVHACTFLVPQVPVVHGPVTVVVVLLTGASSFLGLCFGDYCHGRVTRRRGQEADVQASSTWVAFLFLVFVYAMMNMAVCFTQTRDITNIRSSREDHAGRLGKFQDGELVRVLTPEEHAWHERLQVRIATGFGMFFSLLGAQACFGCLPFEGPRQNAADLGAAADKAARAPPDPQMPRETDEVVGAIPEAKLKPTLLSRVIGAATLVTFCGGVVASISYTHRPGLASFCVAVVAFAAWILHWCESRRLIRWFRYAGGVLEYRTDRDGPQTLPLGQMVGVYRRLTTKGRMPDGWSIQRADGEWLVLADTIKNGQELIDRLCRDGGWNELPPSPV